MRSPHFHFFFGDEPLIGGYFRPFSLAYFAWAAERQRRKQHRAAERLVRVRVDRPHQASYFPQVF
jgi:hypothetical protein